MAQQRQRKGHASRVNVRGFFRVNLVEDGDRIVGDSGWVENQVVADGVLQYLINPLAGAAGLSPLARMALGSGTTPATNATALPGEITDAGATSRATIGAFTAVNSTSVDFPAVWYSTANFVTTTHNIANIMIINSATSGGTIFAGNTFQESMLNTNQDVQATYRVNFSIS